MNLAWYVARGAGLVSWALLALSLTWGFLLSTRVLGRRPKARWLLDLHRFLGGLAVIFVGVHVAAIFLDSYVEFSPAQLLVPLTSDYKPVAVAYGIVAFYLLLAVEITSLLMKRLPRRVWHLIHLASYPLFLLATVHLLTAGTDSTNIVVFVLAILSLVEATVFVIMRLLSRRSSPTRETVGAEPDTSPRWASTPMPVAPPIEPFDPPPARSFAPASAEPRARPFERPAPVRAAPVNGGGRSVSPPVPRSTTAVPSPVPRSVPGPVPRSTGPTTDAVGLPVPIGSESVGSS